MRVKEGLRLGLAFDNLKDEVDYWKGKAEEARLEMAEVKEEFAEYQEGSRELEAELETQLEQVEKKKQGIKSHQ